MYTYVDFFVKFICYLGYFIGLSLFMTPIISPIIKNRAYLYKIRSAGKVKSKKPPRLISHLQLLLYVVYGSRSVVHLVRFLVISICCFIITFTLLLQRGAFGITTFAISLAVGIIPYFYLRLKLHIKRIEGSYEAEGLVTELINQYKINYFNMVEAIDKCIPHLEKYPYSKEALTRLALSVKDYVTDEELESAINEFVYSINTEWAQMLGINIYLAIQDGSNVTESLEDILHELKMLKSVIEKEKKENHESFVLIKYFTFITIAITFLCSTLVFQIDIKKLISYQFYTPVGMKFFSAIVVCMLINFGLLYLLRKPKYDL